MNPIIQSKLPHTGTTIFTVMSALASEHQAINLGQGFPDFSMPDKLIELVAEAMRSGKNQYAHMCGVPDLRQRLSEKIASEYQSSISAEHEITITPGGTYAIYTALTAILQPGDEVIVFEPAYDSYIPNIVANGAKPVTLNLTFPDYRIQWDEVRNAITSRTKAIIVNTPHNPTGMVLDEKDMQELETIVSEFGLYVISDEVYEHLIFDSKTHWSALRYPALYARSFVCYSFGKVYHCTGWKLGYCVAPPDLMKEFRKIHQFNCFSCNAPVQYALAQVLQDPSHYLTLGNMLQRKRDYFMDLMKHTPLKPLPSYGSYFQLYSYAGLTDMNEYDYAVALTKEAGVTTIPVSAFYSSPVNNHVLRFCFAKKEETLDAAAERLATYFNK